jgi:hypothetical protein
VIAISSCRQLSVSDEVARNQVRANRSWQSAFEAILYFADPDPRLASPKVKFIRGENYPPIKRLIMAAALQDDVACLINADIVVSEGLKPIVSAMTRDGALALTSRRYEFEPDKENYDTAVVADHGVDFFAAIPQVWQKCWKEIPNEFRIGHGGWDSWMLGWLNLNCKRRFYDISQYRCIFHPRHASRHQPYSFSVPSPAFSHLSSFPQRA